jgi:hypothetical protein
VLGLLALIGVGVLAALHYATRSIEERVLRALGPESEIGEVRVGLHEVALNDIRVKAPKGWPVETALRAKRVVLTPKLRDLFSDRMELTEVRIEQGYLSGLRPKSGGGLRIMPGLAEKAKHEQGEARRGAAIRKVEFEGCVIEVFDATVPLKPQHVRIDDVTGTVEDIEIPDFSARTQIDLRGVLKGPNHKGTVTVRGWVEVSSKSAELDIQVRNVDLCLFQPYIVTKAKTGVDSGSFNLDLKATVRNNVLHAPGTLTVRGLKLEPPDTPVAAITRIPRRAAVGALADEKDRITVPFNLDGRLDDPTFSIAGKTALQTGIAVAKAFGLSFEGLVRAFFIIISGLGSAFGSAAGAGG